MSDPTRQGGLVHWVILANFLSGILVNDESLPKSAQQSLVFAYLGWFRAKIR